MNMKKRFRISLFYLLAVIAHGMMQNAYAQNIATDTIEIEGVTIYKNRLPENFRPGLKTVSVDSLVFMEKRGLNLTELLSENSPIFIKTYGRGATATASFRGTGASHTLVLWNGLKINSPMSGEVDFSLIPLYFVDDVSIHFGQSSMGFGSGGLGGAIALQSSPDWNTKAGAKIYQSLGSFETYSTAVSTSYGNAKLRGQTRIFRERSSNNFTYRNTAKIGAPVETQQNADYHNYGLLQEIYLRPNAKDMLSAKLWAQENSRGIPKLMSNFSSAETNRQADRTINSIAEFSHYGDVLKWNVSSGLTHRKLGYSLTKTSNEGNPLPVLESQSESNSWYNQLGIRGKPFNWIESSLTGEFNIHSVSSSEKILETGYSGTQNHAVVRGELDANPMSRLYISLIVGQEFIDAKISPITPSLSLEYRLLAKQNLKMRASVGRNYHYPSLNDTHWQPGGNPNLKPEQGVTWETGMGYHCDSDFFSSSIDASIFSAEINNWIMWLPHLKGYWEPINLELVRAKGFELSTSASTLVQEVALKIQGNYSYTRSSIESAGGIIRPESHGMQLPFIPVHSGGVVANAMWRGFYAVYNFTHFSERFTTTSNNPNSFRRLYPYYMSSAALGKDFWAFGTRFGLQLRVDNLLNESYQTILWRPMPGRNFSVMVKAEF
jgi:iron complex outermembrane receptor protein